MQRLKRLFARWFETTALAPAPSDAPGRLDISEIIKRANAFKARLAVVKAQIKPSTFRWYPHDSIDNLLPLDRLLGGERRFPLDLIGEDPVLDVGCADGALSFFLETLGCKVHAVDYPATNFNAMQGVRALKAALGSSVEIHTIDLDSQFTLPHESWGVAFFFGTLYHLKNPFYALEALAGCARCCFLSTRVAQVTPDKRTNLRGAPVAYLLDERELNNDATNYWIFSDAGLRRILERSGWRVCDYATTGNTTSSDPASTRGDERAFCLVKSRILDSMVAVELLKGWHSLEPGGYRWTEKEFSVALKAPPAGRPATLELKFALPETLIGALRSVTLSAAVNGAPLPPETYGRPGEQTYRRTIPPRLLTGDVFRLDFQLDKALPPSDLDKRELGIAVSSMRIHESPVAHSVFTA